MKKESHFRIDKNGTIVRNIKVKEIRRNQSLDLSAINIGYYLITPLIIGVFLGLLIGEKFHKKETGALIGILVGLSGTIYNLVHIVKSNARN